MNPKVGEIRVFRGKYRFRVIDVDIKSDRVTIEWLHPRPSFSRRENGRDTFQSIKSCGRHPLSKQSILKQILDKTRY